MNKYSKQSVEARSKYRRQRACGWKRRYESEKDAEQTGQLVYKCKYCRYWHRSGIEVSK